MIRKFFRIRKRAAIPFGIVALFFSAALAQAPEVAPPAAPPPPPAPAPEQPILIGTTKTTVTPMPTPAPPRARPAPGLVLSEEKENELWSQALDFFEQESDTVGYQTLRQRILVERLDRIPLLARLLEGEVRRKDRVALREAVTEIARRAQCRIGNKAPACPWLNSVWRGHLDSVIFFEDTAGRLERARRLLEEKECAGALVILREAEAREGPNRLVLERLEKAYVCLGDNLQSQAVRDSLMQLDL